MTCQEDIEELIISYFKKDNFSKNCACKQHLEVITDARSRQSECGWFKRRFGEFINKDKKK